MSPQAILVMLLWPGVVFFLFNRFPSQKAVVISFIVGWLFLPQKTGFILPGLPDYTRMSATCYSILIATVIFDFQRFRNYKFSWIDLPIIICSLSPFMASISNNLGVYDGLASSLSQTVRYGFLYLLGRLYLGNFLGMKRLAMAIFVSGLIYMPLCLYEVIMSPQLHRMVYGFMGQRQFIQSIRLGGYRPTVFLFHGLSVGMWMMAATLIGWWFWQSGTLKKVWNIPITFFVAALTVTFILIKSTGAYIYLAYGLMVLFSTKWLRKKILLIILIVSISIYLFLGATGQVSGTKGDQFLDLLSSVISEQRLSSLEFRLDNEEILVEKALERPIFGWGGWGRNRVYDYNSAGELVNISTTDSLWVIQYGINGALGLISIFATSLLPSLMFVVSKSRYPARFWFHPKIAPVAVISVILPIYMLDCTFNN
ncbi:O-antigen ligase domain-containing protein [Crocosphaera watsonii WH 8501]|uniref:O-antigen polymerase n=1 Tax=Crocosphaera watsonii WH 8501 TaxID=165597 RepID=Q4BV80_CROWT|nr:hypothetical protein [Crocosphaera watsonii]EAM47811.1 hypothetical protein CwatDRAFT_0577 [Crocosphaera watsonii WH 8501]